MMKRGLLMARGEAGLEAVLNYEVEARLACEFTAGSQKSAKDLELRKKK